MSENNLILEKKINVTKDKFKYNMTINMDFSGVSQSQLLNWSMQSQVIAAQRVLRECSVDSLNEFVTNGYSVHALSAGTKPVTLAESMESMKQLLASLPSDQRAEMMETLMDGI